ncbi:hypothetical protein AAFG13_04275 [Bradyrhizobium sp. B124]|uniref:hypothetical protein n=1 Tax=Bradyrhizobium sp. B124 TaxID=3140245 RepID=UPI003183584F
MAALAAIPGGCASSAADITPNYVSPVIYQSYTCQQLALEAQGVSARAAALSGAQDSQRTKGTIATTAAVIVFWPAAFLVGGDKQTAAELGQMKGQMVAIEQASIAKKCNIQFQNNPVPEQATARTDLAQPVPHTLRAHQSKHARTANVRSAHLKCTACGKVGWVDTRLDWGEVTNFAKGISG